MPILPLYTYGAIASPLTNVLTGELHRQMSTSWLTIDAWIAEMIVQALEANAAPWARHFALYGAEVFAWHLHADNQGCYVVSVEGSYRWGCAFVSDVELATLEDLVKRLRPTDDNG